MMVISVRQIFIFHFEKRGKNRGEIPGKTHGKTVETSWKTRHIKISEPETTEDSHQISRDKFSTKVFSEYAHGTRNTRAPEHDASSQQHQRARSRHNIPPYSRNCVLKPNSYDFFQTTPVGCKLKSYVDRVSVH